MRKEEENDHPVLGLHCAQEKVLQLPITKCTQWNNCTVCTDNFWKKSSPFIDFQGHCRNLSLSYSYSEIILGLRGSSSGTIVYRGVVRTCQLYWRVTECVCVPLGWFGKNVCVFVCVCLLQRERERERRKGREGRRDKEKREKGCYSSLTLAKVSLSLRCLMTLFGFCSGAPACSDQLHSSPPHRRTVHSIAR